ncbi:MAG: TlpA disulfide reductase family protein, partial [Capnocytophaga sp.]|nr:TlpA disulfide reductase family protein [Capnocytophaga sp.]
DDLISLRNQISPDLLSNTYIEELDGAIAKLEKLQPGQPAPEIYMEDTDGKSFKLSDLKGKNVLIDFWASWCPDCRKESPNLVKIYNTYKDKNFTILGVSLDRNKDHWKEAIATDGLIWQQGFVEGAWKSEAAKTYALRWLPTSILIDSNGIIVARNIENQKLIKDIEKLIK